MNSAYLFIGEKPSKTAHERGWDWKSKRLAGRTLSDVLDEIGVPEAARSFINLFGDTPSAPERADEIRLAYIRAFSEHAKPVAMGAKVARFLAEHGIEHVKIAHPAARGKIRGRNVYIGHVRRALQVS